MQSISINYISHLILLAAAMLAFGCNEQYSGSDNSENSSITQVGQKSATPMKWSDQSLSNTGLNIYVSQDIIDDFNPVDYEDDKNPIQQALQEWNTSISSKTLFNIDSASDENAISSDQKIDLLEYKDNIFAIYKHDYWFDDISPSALAITQFFGKRVNSGTASEYLELIHADIIVNYKNFEFEVGPTSFETYDLNSVILHELGHFLGLNHSSYHEDSVMVPYLDVNTEKRELFDYDDQSIQDLYGKSAGALSSSNASSFTLGRLKSKEVIEESSTSNDDEEIISGIIELQASGECVHYINGHEVSRH